MLKLTIAVLAIVLAGSASAAGWRSLRLDGSSEAGFEKSLAEFQEKLTNGRRHAFTLALHDIWAQGTPKIVDFRVFALKDGAIVAAPQYRATARPWSISVDSWQDGKLVPVVERPKQTRAKGP